MSVLALRETCLDSESVMKTDTLKRQIGHQRAPSKDAATSASQPYTITPPISFRLPKAATKDPFFGATRTFWNQRVLATEANGFNPPIKSIVERQPGRTRGIRFVLYDSARTYFEKLAAEQCGKVSSEKTIQGGGPGHA